MLSAWMPQAYCKGSSALEDGDQLATNAHPANERTMKGAKPSDSLLSVVDDDESVRESLPDLLWVLGYRAKAFASARQFLDSDSLGRTSCLIMDVVMPDMSGPELKRELENRGHDIPTIFITAHPEAAAQPEVQAAAACLIKPFSEASLQDALKKALDKNE